MIKHMMTECYEAPMVEMLDIVVEQGFVNSTFTDIDDVEEGDEF